MSSFAFIVFLNMGRLLLAMLGIVHSLLQDSLYHEIKHVHQNYGRHTGGCRISYDITRREFWRLEHVLCLGVGCITLWKLILWCWNLCSFLITSHKEIANTQCTDKRESRRNGPQIKARKTLLGDPRSNVHIPKSALLCPLLFYLPELRL